VRLTQTTLQSILSGVFLFQRLRYDSTPTLAWENNYTILSCSEGSLTDCDMIRSITIWEVSEEAKENGFPETMADASSLSPATSSGIASAAPLPERVTFENAGERALETSRAETLQERERNSMGSRGVSGGRNMPPWSGSGRQGSVWALSIGSVKEREIKPYGWVGEREREGELKRSESVGCGAYKESGVWVEKKKKSDTRETKQPIVFYLMSVRVAESS